MFKKTLNKFFLTAIAIMSMSNISAARYKNSTFATNAILAATAIFAALFLAEGIKNTMNAERSKALQEAIKQTEDEQNRIKETNANFEKSLKNLAEQVEVLKSPQCNTSPEKKDAENSD